MAVIEAKTKKPRKKGRLRCASGPSLGRKRPRRAAIAPSATAPQQYATALHKAQEFLRHFQSKNSQPLQTCNTPDPKKKIQIFQIFVQVPGRVLRQIREFRDFLMPFINRKSGPDSG
jgi:hypothetical protein